MNINIDELEKLTAQLEKLLPLARELMPFIEAVKSLNGELTLNVTDEKFLLLSDAAKMLNVNPGKISQYVKDGLLQPYYIPNSSYQRFKFSNVCKLAKTPSRKGQK